MKGNKLDIYNSNNGSEGLDLYIGSYEERENQIFEFITKDLTNRVKRLTLNDIGEKNLFHLATLIKDNESIERLTIKNFSQERNGMIEIIKILPSMKISKLGIEDEYKIFELSEELVDVSSICGMANMERACYPKYFPADEILNALIKSLLSTKIDELELRIHNVEKKESVVGLLKILPYINIASLKLSVYEQKISINTILSKSLPHSSEKSFSSFQNLFELSLRKNNIGDDELKIILDSLSKYHIRNINLSQNNITCKGATHLAEKLLLSEGRKNYNIDLSINRIGFLGASDIWKSLGFISHLNLQNNMIGDKGVEALIPFIKENWSLLKLNILFNQASSETERKLIDALKSNFIIKSMQIFCLQQDKQKLDILSERNEEIKSASHIHIVLNPLLQELYKDKLIGTNPDEILFDLYNYFPGRIEQIKDLINVKFSFMDKEYSLDLIRALSKNKDLRSIDFSYFKLNGKELDALKDGLKNSQVQSLNLSGNGLTSESLEIIFKNLPDSLKELNLGNNKIGSNIGILIGDYLIGKKIDLDLSHNEIKDLHYIANKSKISNNITFSKLDLSNNFIGSIFVTDQGSGDSRAIFEYLIIDYLYMSGNKILNNVNKIIEFINKIREIKKQNQFLPFFDITCGVEDKASLELLKECLNECCSTSGFKLNENNIEYSNSIGGSIDEWMIDKE